MRVKAKRIKSKNPRTSKRETERVLRKSQAWEAKRGDAER